ncbi:hypothetical protein [Yoonia sp.]|uniref:hypothetical protein n=1 Tax=Yoonia sp. TaxID=2212373 RepID=UPI002E09A093|nr:hypothetical protein [Yoonia sp.]
MNAHTTTIDNDAAEYKAPYDLRISHAVYKRGDVLVFLTWNQNSGEAAMVLTPRVDKISHDRIVPCVIPLSRAFAWAEETGDEGDIVINAALFCANLGFNPNNLNNITKILGIVRDHLGDLLSTPPRPRDHHEVVADVIITNNTTGAETHKEVRDHG